MSRKFLAALFVTALICCASTGCFRKKKLGVIMPPELTEEEILEMQQALFEDEQGGISQIHTVH